MTIFTLFPTLRIGSVAAGLMSLLLLTAMPGARAQGIPDPTRPPDLASMPSGGVATPESSGPQLQSVRIAAHRSSAIISGQRVSVGDHLGDARVVAITENEVVLNGAGGRQVLKLFPGVSKLAIARSHHAGPRHFRPVR